jgi:hypothetical protein
MNSPSPLRYIAGVLSATVALVATGAALFAWCSFAAKYLSPWADQQIGIVRVPTQCVIGLVFMFVLAVGWNVGATAWFHFVGPPALPGETHGRHAKWRPGYAPPEPVAGACPKCGFTHAWDGTRCGHCKFGEQPATNNQ